MPSDGGSKQRNSAGLQRRFAFAGIDSIRKISLRRSFGETRRNSDRSRHIRRKSSANPSENPLIRSTISGKSGGKRKSGRKLQGGRILGVLGGEASHLPRNEQKQFLNISRKRRDKEKRERERASERERLKVRLHSIKIATYQASRGDDPRHRLAFIRRRKDHDSKGFLGRELRNRRKREKSVF